jgi:CBS domain-containing protein
MITNASGRKIVIDVNQNLMDVRAAKVDRSQWRSTFEPDQTTGVDSSAMLPCKPGVLSQPPEWSIAMNVKDVMTSPVLSVEPDSPILQAIRIMLRRHISGLPVVDKDGRLVGVVTEGDFLRRAETGTQRRRPRWLEFLVGPGRLADEYTRSHGRKVREVMTADPITVTEQTPLDQVVRVMEKHRIKRLPVVRGQELVGIVSRANLLHALAGVARNSTPAASTDQAIRERLLAELGRQSWAPAALIDVIVNEGTVELWGTITDERERQAIMVAAENVPGVKAVRDNLVWIDPATGTVFCASDEPEPAQTKAS